MHSPLAPFFAPQSIAIVGASARPDSLAARLERNLRLGGANRTLYLINPRRTTIGDQPAYPSITAVGSLVDLACIMVPTDRVADALEDCGAAGVKTAIVYSSGFGEVGEEGRVHERQIESIARMYGIRLLGPNCQGLAVFTGEPLFATFSNAFASQTVLAGPVAYVGQSGAIGGAVLDKARERGIGMSLWVSTGNQLDLGVLEVAGAALEREDTRVVLIYMEGLTSGEQLQALAAKAAQLGKRVVLLQVGLSERGARAVASHTGAMLPPSRVLRTMAEELGIDVTADVDELLDAATAACAAAPVVGSRFAVVTSSGGGGIIAADQAESTGFELAELSEQTRADVGELLPHYGSSENPVDVTTALFSGELATLGDDLVELCRRVNVSGAVDSLVIVLTMIVGERADRLAQALSMLAHAGSTPVRVAWLTAYASNASARARLIAAGIPVFSSVSATLRAMERERLRAQRLETMHAGTLVGVPGVVTADGGPADSTASLRMLDAWGVPQPGWTLVASPEEAESFAGVLGRRYAVKGVGSGLQHKTEAQAVHLGVPASDVADRCRQIAAGPAARLGLDGFVIQEMAEPGLEMFVSITRQGDGFPPLLAVGFGGVSIEVDPDVVTATLPTTAGRIRAVLGELRGAALLGEFRGRPARDVDSFIDLIGALCDGFAADTTLTEAELNPVMVYEEGRGARAVDSLFA